MILAINTSTRQFGLGIVSQDGQVISEYILPVTRSGSTLLMPALDLIMRDAGVDVKDLVCIAVTIGPGSFTGLKVGLSVVKGIAFCVEKPVIGVSSLEALALQIADRMLPVTAMIDSRKGEYFVAQFTWEGSRLNRISPDEYLRLDELPEKFPDNTVFIGNDYVAQSQALKGVMGDQVLLAPSHLWQIRASSIGILAIERLRDKRLDDPWIMEPVYMRPPEIRDNPYRLAK